MRFLLTTIFILAVALSVSAQKEGTVHAIGKDSDGDMWYVDTTLVVRPKPPADWMLVVPMYTILEGRTLVFYFKVDCSDSTYQLGKAQSLNRQGETIWEKEEASAWSRFAGHTGNGARIICADQRKKSQRLPVTNDAKVDGR